MRVGVTDINYFSTRDAEGNRTGILHEYLSRISKYAGWQLEYVDGEMQEIVDMLAAGEIDITGGISQNEYTRGHFSFPEQSSGYIYTCIITRDSRTDYIANDFASFEGMTLAVYANANMRNAELDSFCQNNDLKLQRVVYDNYDDYRQSVTRGEADARLALTNELDPGEKIVARFAPNANYFAVTRGNSQLMRELNQALEMISTFEPDFNEALYRKYFGEDSSRLDFSRREREYLSNHTTIRVALLRDWAPFNQTESGRRTKPSGISVDILRLLEERSGLKFEPFLVSSQEEALALLEDGRADMYCGPFDRDYFQQTKNFVCSVPYMTTQTVMVTGEHGLMDAPGRRAALTSGYETPNSFDYSQILRFDSVDESLDAVLNHQADYAIASLLSVEAYQQWHPASTLLTTPVTGADSELSLAYGRHVSPLLLSIVDKAIATMDDNELHPIIFKNTAPNAPFTFTAFLYHNPKAALTAVLVMSLIIVLAVFFIMRLRLKYTQRTAVMGDTYRLVTEMADEYLFEYDFDSDTLRLPDQFCQQTGLPPLLQGDLAPNGVKALVTHFRDKDLAPQSTLEFLCNLPDGTDEWYRATCAVLFQKGVAVRGLGKLKSSQRDHLEKQLLELRANTDDLTGLNERGYCAALVDEYLAGVPTSQKIAFAMMDCDNFKQVNDSLGHLGGDAVLCLLAQQINRLSEDSICGRFGGDEFFLFFKHPPDIQQLRQELESLCAYMNRDFTFEGKCCRTSVSIGAVYRGANGQSFLDLLSQADSALYLAKQNGRNCVQLTEL